MIGIRVRCNERERGRRNAFEIADHISVVCKRPVARVHDERVSARELDDGAVALPDVEKMHSHFALRPFGHRHGGEQQPIRNKRRRDCKRRHDQRDQTVFHHTFDALDFYRTQSHQRFLRFSAALIAASISGMRAFASSYPISNIASVAARETSVGLKS